MTTVDGATRAAAAFIDDRFAVSHFGSGHINETFLVESSSDSYVLQRLNTAVFRDPDAVTANILVVRDHVEGALLPEPIATRAGPWLLRDDAATWRAWRRVAGAAPATRSTAQAASSAGELLGRFHGRIADLDPARLTETLPHFHDPRRRLDELRAATVADHFGRAASAAPELELVDSAGTLVDRAEELAGAVPRRVAHFDAKLDNMLFRAGEAVCLVDLDTLMPGAWFWDVGDLVRTASTAASEDDASAIVDPARLRAALDGYRRGVGGVLEPTEFAALEVAGAIVTFEQAVRFLTDWLNGDVYYRTSRPQQNLDRARAQLRLLASMPGTVLHP